MSVARRLAAAGAVLCLMWTVPGVAQQWRRITGPPTLSFPADHGGHPDTRTEWWYLTANLDASDGRRVGVQLTFFRQGLDPSPPEPGDAKLRARQAVAAHLAVADVTQDRLRHAERVRRADGLLAGFSTDDLDVWLDDWMLVRRPDGSLWAEAEDRVAGIAIALEMRPAKPLVLHGDGGYSRKGADPGNASVYLSWTRLEVAGTVRLDGRSLEVEGEGWFDHEWGSSQLGAGVAGWDWLSLRLDDGSELMVYELRRDDGTPSPYSSGTMVRPNGSTEHLGSADLELDAAGEWTSPDTGATYPSGWRLAVPSAGLELVVTPELEAAELDGRGSTGVVYWEGPVRVTGSRSGEGYVELTGYASDLAGRF